MKPTAIDSAAQDDHELVSRLAAGDESAFREVVRLHDAGLGRMARLYVADAVAISCADALELMTDHLEGALFRSERPG
jgi:hypothetical protein